MAFYNSFYKVFYTGTIFEQGVITTRNCNRHTQGPLRLDLLLSESFSESESTSMLEARASVACNVFATRKIPVLAT